jgi:hypothetical protein
MSVRPEPDVLRRQLEAAAIEQMARELEYERYDVERPGRVGHAEAGLAASRGTERAVYEFKVFGVEEQGWSELASRVRAEANRTDSDYRLILVPWPVTTQVEVADIEGILKAALRGNALSGDT